MILQDIPHSQPFQCVSQLTTFHSSHCRTALLLRNVHRKTSYCKGYHTALSKTVSATWSLGQLTRRHTQRKSSPVLIVPRSMCHSFRADSRKSVSAILLLKSSAGSVHTRVRARTRTQICTRSPSIPFLALQTTFQTFFDVQDFYSIAPTGGWTCKHAQYSSTSSPSTQTTSCSLWSKQS